MRYVHATDAGKRCAVGAAGVANKSSVIILAQALEKSGEP